MQMRFIDRDRFCTAIYNYNCIQCTADLLMGREEKEIGIIILGR